MNDERDSTARYLINGTTIAQEFERAGEASVRDQLTRGLLDAQDAIIAAKWLQGKERDRTDASQAEHLDIARSAKDAAWEAANAARDAAREAKTANTIATLALIAAAIAIAVSIVGVFLG